MFDGIKLFTHSLGLSSKLDFLRCLLLVCTFSIVVSVLVFVYPRQ